MTDTSTVRGLITSAIAGLSGWTVSRWGPDLFGRDTDHVMHHCFTVAVPESRVHSRDGRQRVSEGLLVESTVTVQWAHRLRADAQADDYDAALDAEQDVVAACRGISNAHVLISSMTRRAALEGWVLGTITLTVLHRYTLS